MGITIHPFRATDESAVIALWEACGLTRPWNPPASDIATVRSSGYGEILVACDGEAVVGSVMVGHDGHRGWVYYLAVSPACRRCGVGRRLMAAAEEWLRERAIRKLELMVRRSNGGVAAFYRRIGYEDEPVVTLSRWLDGTQR